VTELPQSLAEISKEAGKNTQVKKKVQIGALHKALKMDDNKKLAKKYSRALEQARKAMAARQRAEDHLAVIRKKHEQQKKHAHLAKK